jgi:hypothetical protein
VKLTDIHPEQLPLWCVQVWFDTTTYLHPGPGWKNWGEPFRTPEEAADMKRIVSEGFIDASRLRVEIYGMGAYLDDLTALIVSDTSLVRAALAMCDPRVLRGLLLAKGV